MKLIPKMIYGMTVVGVLGTGIYSCNEGCIKGTVQHAEKNVDEISGIMRHAISNDPCNAQVLSKGLEQSVQASYKKHEKSIADGKYEKCIEETAQTMRSMQGYVSQHSTPEFQAKFYQENLEEVVSGFTLHNDAANVMLGKSMAALKSSATAYSSDNNDAIFVYAQENLAQNKGYATRLLEESVHVLDAKDFDAKSRKALIEAVNKLGLADNTFFNDLNPEIGKTICKGTLGKMYDRLKQWWDGETKEGNNGQGNNAP